jgi:hypothetical protein
MLTKNEKRGFALLITALVIIGLAAASFILSLLTGGDFFITYASVLAALVAYHVGVFIRKKLEHYPNHEGESESEVAYRRELELRGIKPAKQLLAQDSGGKSSLIPQLYVKIDNETDKVVLTPYGKLWNELDAAEVNFKEAKDLLYNYRNLAKTALLILAIEGEADRSKMIEEYRELLDASDDLLHETAYGWEAGNGEPDTNETEKGL